MAKPQALGPVMGDLRGLTIDTVEREWLQHPLLGGIILFSRNYESPEQLAALVRDLRQIRPDVLLAVDTEGGRVQRFRDGFHRLPATRRYGEYFDQKPVQALSLAEQGGYLLAAELRAFDVDLPFSPVLDVDHGCSGIIGDRAFHSRTQPLSLLAEAHIQGLRRGGAATTMKHFPGHGAVIPDSHLELPVDERSWGEIQRVDLLPFAALARELDSVMMAHIVYPAIDQQPASFSKIWVEDILRYQLGFEGAVFADDLSMGGALGLGDIVARAEAAFAAGCDMMPVCNRPDDLEYLLDAWQCSQPQRGHQRLSRLRRQGQPCIQQTQQAYLELQQAGLVAAKT